MRGCVLKVTGPVEQNRLEYVEIPQPTPAADEVLVKVHACGICRTDLHVVEGELPSRKLPVVPGHQVVGTVQQTGERATRFLPGDRVGVAWLHRTCGICRYCRTGRENLCENANFTGYTVDGGFAEYTLAPEAYVYPIPSGFDDLQAAPLLCAGIIGFRALRLSGIQGGRKLGLYGFGAAAHVAIQVARHWGVEVYTVTRSPRHQELAMELGAVWASGGEQLPPAKLDAAIIFAPAGELVISALNALDKGGTVALAGIHMSTIPPIEYEQLYHEKVIRSVANNTRQDGQEFLSLAAQIPIRTKVQEFPLDHANEALRALKNDAINGAGVLKI